MLIDDAQCRVCGCKMGLDHFVLRRQNRGSVDEQRNLEEDPSGTPIEHPLLGAFFDAFENGHYVRSRSLN